MTDSSAHASSGTLKLGITRMLESQRDIIGDARVGLIANSASVDPDGIPTATLLADAGIRLSAILSPEHGYRGRSAAGEQVPGGFDDDAGLPIFSLYGETRKPTAEMLRDIDALVFDMQDIGTRCYTYIWTMALAMQAAAFFGKLFVVLDRPNPLGGVAVQGPLLDPAFESFLGMYSIPLRHGMTTGELALMFNRHFGIGANLAVIRMKGWRRRLWFSDTGLNWIAPSPAMGSIDSALPYAGTCLLEGTNISEGRGTSAPFRLIGAPWLDGETMARISDDVKGLKLEGFDLTPQRFTPTDSKYAGVECAGFMINTVDREKADPVALVTALLTTIAMHHGDSLEWDETHFDRVAGTDGLRSEILAAASKERPERLRRLEQVFEGWGEQAREFDRSRAQFLLYEG